MEENQLNSKTTITVPVHILLRLRATLKWRESYADKITELLDMYDKLPINNTKVEGEPK